MSPHYLPRHGNRGRDGYPSLPRRIAIVGAVLAASMAVTLGPLYAGGILYGGDDTHAAPIPGVILSPAPTDGPYGDERYQDPSGYAYCTYPDDGFRPCVDAQTEEVRTA